MQVPGVILRTPYYQLTVQSYEVHFLALFNSPGSGTFASMALLLRAPHGSSEQRPEDSVFLHGNILLHFYSVLDWTTRLRKIMMKSLLLSNAFIPLRIRMITLSGIPGTTRVAPVSRPSPKGKRMAEEDIATRPTARPGRVNIHVTWQARARDRRQTLPRIFPRWDGVY